MRSIERALTGMAGAILAMSCAGCLMAGIRVRTDEHPERVGDVAYGYFVFGYQPDPSAAGRDVRVCHRLFQYLDRGEDGEQPAPGAPTYWPTTRQVPPLKERCEDILASYDRPFAERVRAALPASGSWQVFLMAQDAPFGASAQSRVCVDLTSAMDATLDEKELRKGMWDWGHLMRGGPDNWHHRSFPAFVHQVLTAFSERGNVHVDCK
jgi:hypothetical protein